MSVLHTYFHRRDQQAFQRALDASIKALAAPEPRPSTSAGRSLSTSPHIAHAATGLDVNARDALGRTVLHLACASTHPSAPTYVRLLLAHPHIQPNAQDAESHWTPLHRAMYHGNLASALLLLQRGDVDVSIKDWEGYTAYDVWNSSIDGTKPARIPRRDMIDEDWDEIEAEMYVWGSNRNAGLGVGDGDDRAFPEVVQFDKVRVGRTVDERFRPTKVHGLAMARFHTAMVTTDPRMNVRICGFGSGGRLGQGIHTTTYTPTPLSGLPTSSTSGYSSPARPALRAAHSSSQSHSLPHIRPERQLSQRAPTVDPQRIVALAAGQDHTLALSASGEVWSWGNNRNSVLGYVIEPAMGGVDEPDDKEGTVQAVPRKVQGQLKGRRVRSVAACRTASACVCEDGEVLTWGVNSGQLGYDRAAHPVQVLPRVVTKVNQPVLEATITDSATALLLASHDVHVLWADTAFRLAFPAQTFPSAIAAYRPPQAVRNTSIDRVVATELSASNSAGGRESAMFAALSANGELFTWVMGAPEAGGGAKERERERERRETVRPQRVWALRKKFSAVKDVALGADGSILVCTESGHVYLRSRTPASAATGGADVDPGGAQSAGKAFKFQRVPYLQRVVRVFANSTGAYAALRVDASVEEVRVEGEVIRESMAGVVPWFGPHALASLVDAPKTREGAEDGLEAEADVLRDAEDDVHDPLITHDQAELRKLLALLESHATARKAAAPSPLDGEGARAHGADLLVHVLGGAEPRIPAHRVVLAARSRVLRDVLAGKSAVDAKIVGSTSAIRFALAKDKPPQIPATSAPNPAPWARPSRLTISGAHPLSVLIFLTYLYTDTLIAIWDWRVAGLSSLKAPFEKLKVRPAQVKAELHAMATALELSEMEKAMEGAFKRDVSETVGRDFTRVFEEVCAAEKVAEKELARDSLRPDVVLLLGDRQVSAHSVVLRARSPFFKAFFDEEVWTVNRWTEEGTLKVDLRHLSWRAMRFVVRYLYGGEGEMFEVLDDVNTIDELLEFMFSVMSAANELLLDRLVLLCSSVIQRRVTIPNACSILSEATYFNALPLVKSVQGYMARNLETLLESRMLDDLPADLIKQFSIFIREEQRRKAPWARSSTLVDDAMAKNKAWLDTQDFPQPIVRTNAPRPPAIRRKVSLVISPAASPAVRPLASTRAGVNTVVPDGADDGVFMMDSVDAIPPLSLSQPLTPRIPPVVSPDAGARPSAGWKVASNVPKADMKTIMAEAASTRPLAAGPSTPRTPAASDAVNWRTPQRKTVALQDSPRAPSGSPWKTVPAVPSVVNLASGHSPLPTPPMTPQMRATRPRDEVPSAGPSGVARSQPPTPQKPGMGPVFSPSKQAPAKTTPSPGMRRVSSNAAAWTLPPVQPVVQPTSTASGMSFIAIQELQREQESLGAPKKDKRSLKQIQEEEQARQVEEDFMRWWQAEEERLRLEQMPPEAGPPAVREKGKGRGKKRDGEKKEGARDGVKGTAKDGKDGKDGPKGGLRQPTKRDGGQGGEDGPSSAPRRRRRPGPVTTAKPEAKLAVAP